MNKQIHYFTGNMYNYLETVAMGFSGNIFGNIVAASVKPKCL